VLVRYIIAIFFKMPERKEWWYRIKEVLRNVMSCHEDAKAPGK
jgi:hypothetical protein